MKEFNSYKRKARLAPKRRIVMGDIKIEYPNLYI